MFYYLEGTVAVIEPSLAVIDVGGVGYCCSATANTVSRLERGKKARLYTYLNVREGAVELFGFADLQEKRCFELLISVSGVGPKAALAVLSVNTPENFSLAVATGNERALTAAPGVGKRIAQRIILELKDKVAGEAADFASGGVSVPGGAAAGSVVEEAAAALVVLGYTQQEITSALRKVNTDGMTVEQIIRAVLQASIK